MNNNRSPRQKAIAKRRTFIMICAAILVVAIVAITISTIAIVKALKKGDVKPETSEVPSSSQTSSTASPDNSAPDYSGPNGLDINYKRLILVNNANPLPQDYDYEGNLTTIEDKYINGSLKQIDKQVWPYMKAMIEAAWADGVKLYVWSPYRSYATQKMLFDKQIDRVIASGTPKEQAETVAATVVARPGTSEHHTGLAADFNMASDRFEQTQMFTWMQEHAADFGFIMRYPKDKTEVTGVIYESWHYRFVGINAAKEMNRLDMCLEEYTEYLKK